MKIHGTEIDIATSIAVGYVVPPGSFPRHTFRRWGQALFWCLRLLRAFDKGGSQAAILLLSQVPSSPPSLTDYLPELQVRKVQKDAACLRCLFHLLVDARTCLSESLALCAGLRCLGWKCTVVEGYACVQLFASTKMHAWVDYQGVPVSDVLDVQYGYVPVQRYRASQEKGS